MPRCSKDVEIELSDGTIVEATVHVDGFLDERFRADADGNRGQATWLIDAWEAEHGESLDEDQQEEFDEQIEELVFSESWDFDHAGDADDADDLED